jgi:hypothetical protein
MQDTRHSIGVPCFVINVSERTDRADFALQESRLVGLRPTFISATKASEVNLDTRAITKQTAGRIACWLSHRRSWEAGLSSGADYFLVLEDDVRWLLDPRPLLDVIAQLPPGAFDILQLGSLQQRPTNVPRRALAAAKVGQYVRVLSKVSRSARELESWLISNYQLMARSLEAGPQLRPGADWINWNSFGSGTHSYIVGAHMVSHLLEFNCPTYLAADDALAVLASQGTFSIGEVVPPMTIQAPLGSDLR